MAREEWGIGVVGLGNIAGHHLTAYRREGLRVIGGADIDPDRRSAAKEKGNLEFVVESADELIRHPEVRVVDITVPHVMEIRRPIVEAAARAGKAIFIQKPLMSHLSDARLLVEIAEAAGTPMMVNQNSLFAPQFLAMEPYFRPNEGSPVKGHIGDPYYFQIENRAWFDVGPHPWFGKSTRWVNSDMAIHHYALVRHWFGEAASVSATLHHDPCQTEVAGDTTSAAMIRFRSGLSGLVLNNWGYRGAQKRPHPIEEVIVQGSRGSMTFDGREIALSGIDGDHRIPVEGTWFPDAFGRSMAHFIDALDQGRPFLCSGRDNLKSLAVMEAAYLSAAERREVSVDDPALG